MFPKVIGAVLGLCVGLVGREPLAALLLGAVGAALGHLFFGGAREATPPPKRVIPVVPPLGTPPLADAQVDVTPLARLFVALAASDGPVSQVEIHRAREFFGPLESQTQAQTLSLRNAFKEAMASSEDIDSAAASSRDLLSPSLRPKLYAALYATALVDGPVNRMEAACLKRMAAGLNLSDLQVQAVVANFDPQVAPAFATLNLSTDATDDEIRTAFKKLASDHHPDRFGAADSPEAVRHAETFRTVQSAYEVLRRLRGF